METVRPLTDADMPAFWAIMQEYLFGDEDFIETMRHSYPLAYGGYFIGDELVGICYGWPRSEQVSDDDSFTLDGICIKEPYNAAGRGGVLLRFFEEGAAAYGAPSVSMGSAEGYAERFYIKNGYLPIEFKVMRKNAPTYVMPLHGMEDYNRLTAEERDRIEAEVGGNHRFVVLAKEF